MRTDTWRDGPPGTVVSSMSTGSFLTGPDWTAPPTFAQSPTSTGMRQVIVIGVRRLTLPGSACAHRGSGAAGWHGCAPDLAGPGRSLLRPQAVPASGER